MAAQSRIEWTESTWNPVTGCTKLSPGCKHCYAERMAKRLKAMGQPNYINGFTPTTHEKTLDVRVVVWVILYLFEHTGEDFQSEVLLVT